MMLWKIEIECELCTLYYKLQFDICIKHLQIWNSTKWYELWWIILWLLKIEEDLI